MRIIVKRAVEASTSSRDTWQVVLESVRRCSYGVKWGFSSVDRSRSDDTAGAVVPIKRMKSVSGIFWKQR